MRSKQKAKSETSSLSWQWLLTLQKVQLAILPESAL